MMSIDDLSHLLAGQKITSRQLVEQALAAIKDSQGEGPRTFLQVHENEALECVQFCAAEPARVDLVSSGAGIRISIKDLFDEAVR
jgi:aspartyl-tRNA(Asn)/glutamyl-tRNA(Gln) amidotransferase subunit A